MKSWILQYIKSGLVMKSWLFYLVLICHENIDFSLQSHVVMKIWPFLPVLNCHEPRTWHSYFWSCHPWLDSFTSDLVIYDFTLIILVLSAMTCFSYFWSCQLRFFPCHLWNANHKLSFYFLVWSLRLDFHILNWTNTTWLPYFWSSQHVLTFIILVLEFSGFDHPSSLELI